MNGILENIGSNSIILYDYTVIPVSYSFPDRHIILYKVLKIVIQML